MHWLNPSAWIALAALAAPILIHILVQRKAERLPFPTLRFIQPTRLAAIRRHVLEDVWLLALRAAILAAAVAALAGPLVVTPMRRQAWNARIVRAIVSDDGARTSQPRAFLVQTFNAPSLRDGIERALAWLDHAPPARRELVIVGPLALDSITADEISGVPPAIGIRFERSGTLPTERTIAGGKVLALERNAFSRSPFVYPMLLHQTVALNGAATSVVEDRVLAGVQGQTPESASQRGQTLESASRRGLTPESQSFPVGFAGDVAGLPAMAAVLSQRVWTVPAERHARLVLADTSVNEEAVAGAGPLTQPWMADAVARIARDEELQGAAVTETGLVDARFGAAPWAALATAADGRRLAVAAGSSAGLLVVSAAEASRLVTPLLLRAIANGLADVPDLRAAEVLHIPDAQLQTWTRPAAPVLVPRLDDVEQDDRRWLWALVLLLLAAESWVRRARRVAADEPEARARVA